MWETLAEYPYQGTPDGAMLHSINTDPRDANHVYIGLSSGGVFETTDGGSNWVPLNRGIFGEFLPTPMPSSATTPTAFASIRRCRNGCNSRTTVGCRIDHPADRWVRIGHIGRPVELHPRDPDTARVFPMDGTEVWPRTSPDGRPALYVTHDGGDTFERQDSGLPERAWFTVKRQAMTTDSQDSVGVYIGTIGGELWASANGGESWACAASHLPEIFSVEVLLDARVSGNSDS